MAFNVSFRSALPRASSFSTSPRGSLSQRERLEGLRRHCARNYTDRTVLQAPECRNAEPAVSITFCRRRSCAVCWTLLSKPLPALLLDAVVICALALRFLICSSSPIRHFQLRSAVFYSR
ncbi:hypothetical protein MHYP_G00090020 [Metynnis hypsauchen]